MRSKRNRVWNQLAVSAIITSFVGVSIGVAFASRQTTSQPGAGSHTPPSSKVEQVFAAPAPLASTRTSGLGIQPGIQARPAQVDLTLAQSLYSTPDDPTGAEETRQIMLQSLAQTDPPKDDSDKAKNATVVGGGAAAGSGSSAAGAGGAAGAGAGGASGASGASIGAIGAGVGAAAGAGAAAGSSNSGSDPSPASPAIPGFP